MDDPTLSVLALLGLAALTAGFVDAVVGGGGLIQLPALLLGLPAASPVEVLATNKLASICGTTVSCGDVLPADPARPADVPAADGCSRSSARRPGRRSRS